jgi:glycosyltransferase involved in cell wall biosynthesis
MRVLMISHTCQSRTAGQPKAARLARVPGLHLRVLVPDRWLEYGEWKRAQRPLDGALDLRVGKVLWPWAGPAQWYAHWYPRLAPIMREFQPDIIDLWEEPWGLVSAQACWLRDRLVPHAKIIAETEQNIDKVLPLPFEAFRSYTLGRADFAIGRNREALQVLGRKGYSGPSEVVPNAVDAELFRALDRVQCRAQLLREIGLARSPLEGEPAFLAGYVGRLVEEKGLGDLLEALVLSAKDVHAVFVGGGVWEEQGRRHASELGVAGRVHFLPARRLEELPAVMNALDAFVLPSRTTPRWKEQFGRVIIEAHACCTPVIGSDSGAIPEVIGEGGLIFPEGDAPALAQCVAELRGQPERRRQMGAAGRRQVEEHYTWERVAQRMHAIYQRVLT